MKNYELLDAIGGIDAKYVENASLKRKPGSTFLWAKIVPVAACFVVLLVGASSIWTNHFNQQNVTPPDDLNRISETDHNEKPNDDIAASPDNTTSSATSKIRINMSEIFLNEINDFIDADYARYNPETDEKVVWHKDNIINYYGTDLTLAYIPAGLFASPQNDTATVWVGQDGKIVEDTIGLGFYSGFYEDGSPKLTEDVSAVQGFSITVSKIGIVNDCIYLLPENEVKTSDIGGNAVTFGYRSMPYGPYDSETHEPSGYYDMYSVEFECEGNEYMIIAYQMEIEELVKVVSSIIYGEEEITIYPTE